MKINIVDQTIKTVLLKILILVLPWLVGSALGYSFGILLFIIIEFLIIKFGAGFSMPWLWVIIKLILLLISLAFSFQAALKFKLITNSELQTSQPRIYLKYASNCLMLYFWIGLSMFFVLSLVIFLL